jgi:hypothetical protein
MVNLVQFIFDNFRHILVDRYVNNIKYELTICRGNEVGFELIDFYYLQSNSYGQYYIKQTLYVHQTSEQLPIATA